jgi:SAM-dependent methyltransferase
MKKVEDLFKARASSPLETAMLYDGRVGFTIPEYQRQYDWSKDNIMRLYFDTPNGFRRLSCEQLRLGTASRSLLAAKIFLRFAGIMYGHGLISRLNEFYTVHHNLFTGAFEMTLAKEAYEQNYQQFRSLNQIMWQIPVLAMTLTGGLWFGVSKIEDRPLLAVMLLLTAVVGNITLAIILRRFRFVMSRYLIWLKNASEEDFVDAREPDDSMNRWDRFFTKEERVRQMFSFLLCWGALASAILLFAEAHAWYKDRTDMSRTQGIDFYEQHAAALADGYEAVSFENAYPFLVTEFAGGPLVVLDVGAGTGRDAAWIAARGHDVYAVEPSAAMRTIAGSLHKDERITWIDAQLPDLRAPALQPGAFDIILANAVWMHVPPEERQPSMRRMYELTRGGGRAYISLRLGPQDERRGMFAVSADEFIAAAENAGFTVVHRGDFADLLGRAEVSWKMFEFQKPN